MFKNKENFAAPITYTTPYQQQTNISTIFEIHQPQVQDSLLQ